MQKYCWMDLFGFNKEDADLGAKRFLTSVDSKIEGVIILFSEITFYLSYKKESDTAPLRVCDCAYGGVKRYEREKFPIWNKGELKQLVKNLHANGVKVYFTIFDGCRQYEGEKYDESILQRTYDNAVNSVVNLLAENSGEKFVDNLGKKIGEVIDYYGLDGIHFADGISTRRFPLQLLPFLDSDIESLKKQYNNIKEDREIKKFDKISDENLRIKKRSIYCFAKYKKEWVEYCSKRWAEAFNKLSKVIADKNKEVVFNVAWLRDPFESYYRYGFDYSQIDFSYCKAIIVNDVNRKITPESDNCGFKIYHDEYKYCENDAPANRLLTVINSKETEQFALSPLRDINENWDVLRDAPNTVLIKALRRNGCYYFDGEYKRINQGVVYCLSSGVEDDEWQKVKEVEDISTASFIKPYGFSLIGKRESYKRELKEYVERRRPSVYDMTKELQICQMPLYTITETENIEKIDMPLVCMYLEYFSDSEIEQLEKYTLNPLIIFTNKDTALKRKCNISFIAENGFNCYIYNVKASGEYAVKNIIKNLNRLNTREKAESIWIKKLSYATVDRVVLRKICKYVLKELNMISIIGNKDIMYNAYQTESELTVVLDNPCSKPVQCEVRYKNKKEKARVLDNGSCIIKFTGK